MEYPSTLISTKFRMPQISGGLVRRSRLSKKMRSGLNRKVTIISAPAGYGKTTLAICCLQDQPTPVAWLSISEKDNDLSHYLSYLVAALQTIFPKSFQNTQSLLEASLQPAIDYFASTLINDISMIPNQAAEPSLILALDDYHLIENKAIHQLMSLLIEFQPAQLHMVIIGRQDPFQLPIVQLRARQETMEIRQADLRFNLDETQLFIQQALETDIAEDIVALIDDRIEGWAVGLSLTTLTLHDIDDPVTLLQGLKGTSRYFMEYLLDEVLSQQPQAIQLFMLKISILERFCVPLCDHISGMDNPQYNGLGYLQWLEKTNLFVTPLDIHREWYRYHHLFQDLLASKLKAEFPDSEIKKLHCRASHWFSENGFVEEAIHHALEADDIELAVKIVEENGQYLLNRQERHTLERWISMLPQIIIWERPRLLLVQAWILFRQWRHTDLGAVLDKIDLLLNQTASSMTQEEVQFLRGQLLALRSAVKYIVHGDYPTALALSDEALEKLPKPAAGARSLAISFGALSRQALGQTDKAVSQLQMVIRDTAPLGPAKVQAYIALSLVNLHSADLVQMQATSDQFLALADSTEQANVVQGANHVAGLLNYEWDNLPTAEAHFKKVLELHHRSNFMASFVAGLCLARINQARGKLDQAQKIFDELREFTFRINNNDLLSSLEAAQAEQWLYKNNIPAARRWAQSFRTDATLDKVFKFELPILTQTRILLSNSSKAEIQVMRRRLEHELQDLIANNFTYRAIQTLAHMALVYDQLAMAKEALGALQRAIVLAQGGGLIRSFLDCGPKLIPLLEQLPAYDVDSHYVQQILAAFGLDDRNSEAITFYPLDPLTRREQEVLQLIADGLTNQEIADKLFITLNTVKRHNSNIFRKLEVSNRREAFRKSRQIGNLL